MKFTNKSPTKEELQEAVRQFLEERGDDPDITYADLRSRVLSGYTYMIGSGAGPPTEDDDRNIVAYTGKGGALMFLDTCEEMGLPAMIAADNLMALTNRGNLPLSVLNVQENRKSDEPEKPAEL